MTFFAVTIFTGDAFTVYLTIGMFLALGDDIQRNVAF